MKYSLVFIQIVFLAVIFQNDISNAKRILHNKKSINKLEGFLKRLFEEDSNFEDSALKTVPYSDSEIEELLQKLADVENDEICLQSEQCAWKWMDDYNFIYEKINEKSTVLEFEFETNLTDANQKKLDDFAPISNKLQVITKNPAIKFLKNSRYWDPELRRMLYLASLKLVFNDEKDVQKISNLSGRLESIFGTAHVCTKGSEKCLSLDPDITQLLKESRDYDELLMLWKGWHDASGRKMRDTYSESVKVQQKVAQENGYNDLSEVWMEDFEEDNLEEIMDQLFEKVKPLYQEIHAYVRRKLNNIYGSKYPDFHDPKLIPAHVLGNMWAQTWENIYDLVAPYPEVEEANLTQILIQNHYDPTTMFKQAEDFFVSIGLNKMTPTFWKESVITKPKDRDIICHASAADFYNGFDFRIKMCTSVNRENFFTIHHEMGHIEYYMAYSKQPAIFRTGANSAFHEAIGDTISLSVWSPTHLNKIHLTQKTMMTYEQEINFLMKIALNKIAFLPFAYLVDKWRWNVFRGVIDETNYNQKWWEMKNNYQGVEAPVPRSEDDFDPGSKYHIATNTPYVRYFFSHFLQFQFYKSLCDYSNHDGPLYQCDFYKSKHAGYRLKKMLELGASKHWKIALHTLTNKDRVEADPILEYFEPLAQWLRAENAKYPNDKPGF